MPKRRKTHDEFVKEVYKIHKDNYTILGKYKTSKEPVLLKHNTCNYEWKSPPSNILRGYGCPKCAGNTKKTTEQYKQEIFNLVGDEYEVLGEYINSRTKITIKHNLCNRKFNIRPYSFKSGVRCNCNNHKTYRNNGKNIKIRWTQYSYSNKVYELTNNEYDVLGEYVNSSTKILMRHNKCGNEYLVEPNNFLKGRRCPECSHGHRKKTTEQFKQEVYDLVGNEYIVTGEYVNNKTPIKMLHHKCSNEIKIAPHDFIKGCRCIYCKGSKGEKKIEKYFEEFNIKYTTQKKFVKCKYKNPLPFDFAISDNDNTVNFLIEYDGEQHFREIKHFGGIAKFKINKKRDQIKNTYCVNNNIPLIRIPYWEFNNIEYILQNVLIHFSLINNENNTYDKWIVNKYLVDSEWNHDTYLSWNDKDKSDIPMKRELIHN